MIKKQPKGDKHPQAGLLLLVTKHKNNVVLLIGDKAAIEKYLQACEEYLKNTHHRRSMKYPWPNLKQKCLLCGGPECAIYKGYYSRILFCPEMEVFGRIVIRTAFCKSRQERFSLAPDFTLPRAKFSQSS